MNQHARRRCVALTLVAGAVPLMLWGCGGTPPAPSEPVGIPEATIEEHPAVEEWTSVPLPDGTVFYARYGKPGGVRIRRGPSGARGVLEESVAAAPGPIATPPAAVAPPAPLPAEHLTAQVRQILVEELAALPEAPRYRVEITRPDPATPRDTLAARPRWTEVPAPSTPAEPSPVASTPAPDTLAMCAAPFRDTPVPPPEVAIDTLRPVLPAGPMEVREAFTSEGLFATQLLLFESGGSDVLPVSQQILEVVAGVLRKFPGARLRVEGYTDDRGRAEANLELSRRRAEAVRDFLVDACGLEAERVEAVGYGEGSPVMEGSSPTALAVNRRVQLRVLNPDALRRPAGVR